MEMNALGPTSNQVRADLVGLKSVVVAWLRPKLSAISTDMTVRLARCGPSYQVAKEMRYRLTSSH